MSLVGMICEERKTKPKRELEASVHFVNEHGKKKKNKKKKKQIEKKKKNGLEF